ncbi:MAG TPA: L,D-transpeptidase family protein [Verrucomicrobiales bacterium]|nr:L,D-transpeptidase family protein [Verrucomicrobiales bacterium]
MGEIGRERAASPDAKRVRLLLGWLAGLAAVLITAWGFVHGDRYLALRELRQQGVDAGPDAMTEAVRMGNTGRLGLLRRAGISWNEADSRGVRPVWAAVESGNTDALKLFDKWKHRVRFDVRGPDGEGLVQTALQSGNAGVADVVLRRAAPSDFEIVTAGGETVPAVIWLVQQRQAGLLRLVLDKPGINCDAADGQGRTALMRAVELGEPALAGMLLDAGADPGRKDAAGKTPAALAMDRGDAAMLGLLLARAKLGSGAVDMSHALQAFEMGRSDLLKMLLQWGLEVPQQTRSEWLARAAENGDDVTVRALLEMGWRPEENVGEKLLRGALDRGHYPVMIPLLAAGASSDGLLTQAMRCGHESIAELLFAWAPPQADERSRLLEEGIVRGNRAICRRLLELGAPVEGVLPSGQRPLLAAVAAGQSAIVEDLLDLGANPETPVQEPVSEAFLALFEGNENAKRMRFFLLKDEEVRPLMLAALLGDLVSAKRLMQFGAYPNRYTAKQKFYPVNFAIQGGHHDITRLVLGSDPNNRERRIEISLGRQEAVLYRDGEASLTTKVSTGRKGYATPKGTFVITNKHRTWVSTLYHSSMPYFMRLNCGDFGLHQGYVPGYPASHGCVRVPGGTAGRLYQVMQVGDLVEILP